MSTNLHSFILCHYCDTSIGGRYYDDTTDSVAISIIANSNPYGLRVFKYYKNITVIKVHNRRKILKTNKLEQ